MEGHRISRVAPARGELVLYVDESGEHGMDNINPDFPVLTIAGCAFASSGYAAFERDVSLSKRDVLGKPDACIHSRDIRNWEGDFAGVRRGERGAVQAAISGFVSGAQFTLITVTIRKDRLGAAYGSPTPPYELAIQYLLERFYKLLRHVRLQGKVHPESRGKREDATVADEYSRFRTRGFLWATPADVQSRMPGPIVFGNKRQRCAGLELADLAAYPVARYVLDQAKPNPAFEVLRPKLYAGGAQTTDYSAGPGPDFSVTVGGMFFLEQDTYEREVTKYGLKVFP